MSKKTKKFWEMTTAELAEATKEFDREHVADTFREMTPEEKARWTRLKRSRPRRNPSSKRISISLEVGLLQRVTQAAKRQRMSRSQFLAQAAETALTPPSTSG